MSSCCGGNSEPTPIEQIEDKEPNSIIGKFLYRIGKADAQKNDGKEKQKGGSCCG